MLLQERAEVMTGEMLNFFISALKNFLHTLKVVVEKRDVL